MRITIVEATGGQVHRLAPRALCVLLALGALGVPACGHDDLADGRFGPCIDYPVAPFDDRTIALVDIVQFIPVEQRLDTWISEHGDVAAGESPRDAHTVVVGVLPSHACALRPQLARLAAPMRLQLFAALHGLDDVTALAKRVAAAPLLPGVEEVDAAYTGTVWALETDASVDSRAVCRKLAARYTGGDPSWFTCLYEEAVGS